MDSKTLTAALDRIDTTMIELTNTRGSEITINDVRNTIAALIPNIVEHELYDNFVDKLCRKYNVYDTLADNGAEYLVSYFEDLLTSHEGKVKDGRVLKEGAGTYENLYDLGLEVTKAYMNNTLNSRSFYTMSIEHGLVFVIKSIKPIINILVNEAHVEKIRYKLIWKH